MKVKWISGQRYVFFQVCLGWCQLVEDAYLGLCQPVEELGGCG